MNTARSPLILGLALSLVLLAGCLEESGVPLEVKSPIGGNTVADLEFEVVGRASIDPGSVEFEINGNTFTPANLRLDTANSAITVRGDLDRSHLLDGKFNSFVVSARLTGGEAVEARSNFVWLATGSTGAATPAASSAAASSSTSTPGATGTDQRTRGGLLSDLIPGKGPQIRIDSPTLGEFLRPGEPFEIRGQVSDPDGVAELELSLDGETPQSRILSLDPVTGTFLLEAVLDEPGLHRIQLRATDSLGEASGAKVSVHVGESRAGNHRIERASQFSLTDRGFEVLGKILEAKMTPDYVYDEIPRNDVLWETNAGFLESKLTILGLGHEHMDLQLGTKGNHLRFVATTDNFFLSTKVRTKAIGFSSTAFPIVRIPNIRYDAITTLSKDLGGKLQMKVIDLQTAMSGLEFEIPGVPGFVTSRARSFMETFVTEAMNESFEEKVLPIFARKIEGDFSLATPKALEHADLDVAGSVDSMRIEDGVGYFYSHTQIAAQTEKVEVEPIQEGWLWTANDDLFQVEPRNNINLAIADDSFNQALYELYRTGLFHIDLEEIQTLGLLDDLLGPDSSLSAIFSPEFPIKVELVPMLAPVVQFGRDDNDLTLQLHEVYIDISLIIEDSKQLLLRLAFDLDVPLDEVVIDKKEKVVQFQPQTLSGGAEASLLPFLDFRVEEIPLVEFGLTSETLVDMIAQVALPFSMNLFHTSTGDSSLPIGEMELDGNDEHLFIFGELLEPPVANNSGPNNYGIGNMWEEEETEISMQFCGLISLAGGTPAAPMLDLYRAFRDRWMRFLPRGEQTIGAYYGQSGILSLLLAIDPGLRLPLLLLFVLGGFVLGVILTAEPLLWIVIGAIGIRTMTRCRKRCQGLRIACERA